MRQAVSRGGTVLLLAERRKCEFRYPTPHAPSAHPCPDCLIAIYLRDPLEVTIGRDGDEQLVVTVGVDLDRKSVV